MPRNRIDLLLKVLIAGLAVALIVIIAGSIRERVVETGDKAPDFSITTDNGRKITPTDFGGRVLVLNFWATWCPPCRAEVPSLNQFQQKLADKGVVVVAVSVDRNEKAYRAFLRQYRVGFQTARDPDANLPGEFGTFKFPETYIIDSHGKVAMKVINERDWMADDIIHFVQSI